MPEGMWCDPRFDVEFITMNFPLKQTLLRYYVYVPGLSDDGNEEVGYYYLDVIAGREMRSYATEREAQIFLESQVRGCVLRHNLDESMLYLAAVVIALPANIHPPMFFPLRDLDL